MATAISPALLTSPSFKGQYHFVNHDATNRKSAPHRHAVFTHVQSKYSKWKRRWDARLLRESVQIPRLIQRKAVERDQRKDVVEYATSDFGNGPVVPSPEFTKAAAEILVPLSSDTSGLTIVNTTAAASDRTLFTIILLPEELEEQIPAPLTILQEGDSDPFNTFAIPIDSDVNYLMSFCREIELPSINSEGGNPERTVMAADWAHCVSSLTDACTAYAFLTRVASAIPTDPVDRRPGLTRKSLLFKGKAVALLRERLTHETALSDEHAFSAIMSLVNAELYAQNFPAALFHLQILAHTLQTGLIQIDLMRTFRCVYYDYQRAAMAQTHTVFDYKVWMPAHFGPMWVAARSRLPRKALFEDLALHLEPELDDRVLRNLFVGLRHCQETWILIVTEKQFRDIPTRAYLRTFATYCMAQLQNHYINSQAKLDALRLNNTNLISSAQATRARMSTIVSLAAQFWIRWVGDVDVFRIGTKCVFGANAVIMERLRLAVEDWEVRKTSTSSLGNQYEKPMLWALFVGAWAEQAKAWKAGVEGAEREWFNVRLRKHVDGIGLSTWKGVKEVLVGFIHNDSVQPNGREWFDETMGPVGDGRHWGGVGMG